MHLQKEFFRFAPVMLKLFHPVLPLLALLVFPLVLQGQDEADETESAAAVQRPASSDKTSKRIIDLHLKARGGKDKLRSLPVVRMEGELVENIKEYSLNIIHKAPNLIRLESTITHLGDDYVTISASDGTNAWRQETQPERKNPNKISGLDKQLLELDAMLPFLFSFHEEAGHVFAYRGKDTYAKRDAYVLHGWLSNGMELDILFDAESFHIINYRHPYAIGGKTVEIDRPPAGLIRVGDTWWEKGYFYRFRGKAFRKVSFEEISPAAEPAGDSFTEPPTRERWLRIKR